MIQIENGSGIVFAETYLPNRKKPVLCKIDGNVITVYGTFKDKEASEQFFMDLTEWLGAEKENE